MQKRLYYLFFILLLFFIPCNIYIIGDWIGVGIQFAGIKAQFSGYGNSIITFNQDLSYIFSGLIIGKSALAVIIWLMGFSLIMVSLFIFLADIKKDIPDLKLLGLIVIFSAICFLVSNIIQYGLYFHGPAGTVIPIGLPILFIIGGWLYYEGSKIETEDEMENHESQN